MLLNTTIVKQKLLFYRTNSFTKDVQPLKTTKIVANLNFTKLVTLC